jgi:hypothetical protein
MSDVIDDAVESLLGLFGENAPENAAIDIAMGYDLSLADAEEIWERYNNRIKHMEG